MAMSCENLHLSPLEQQFHLKNSHSTVLGSVPSGSSGCFTLMPFLWSRKSSSACAFFFCSRKFAIPICVVGSCRSFARCLASSDCARAVRQRSRRR